MQVPTQKGKENPFIEQKRKLGEMQKTVMTIHWLSLFSEKKSLSFSCWSLLWYQGLRTPQSGLPNLFHWDLSLLLFFFFFFYKTKYVFLKDLGDIHLKCSHQRKQLPCLLVTVVSQEPSFHKQHLTNRISHQTFPPPARVSLCFSTSLFQCFQTLSSFDSWELSSISLPFCGCFG